MFPSRTADARQWFAVPQPDIIPQSCWLMWVLCLPFPSSGTHIRVPKALQCCAHGLPGSQMEWSQPCSSWALLGLQVSPPTNKCTTVPNRKSLTCGVTVSLKQTFQVRVHGNIAHVMTDRPSSVDSHSSENANSPHPVVYQVIFARLSVPLAEPASAMI
jgi:hypothetical protein